jgi:pimeloyl-ACP methyl ester carboxylesterase
MDVPAPTRIRLGRGEPLLLVHGLGHSKEGWDPVLPALAADHDVVALDLPGFGAAPPLAVPPTDEALVDHCEAVMDELGWPTAHLVGSSLGGLLAIRLAGRGRARTVTALAPAGQPRGWERTWARALLRASRAAAPLAARVPAVWSTSTGRAVALGAHFGRPRDVRPAYARLAIEGLARSTAFEATLRETVDAVDVKPVDVPVTIAWGTRDVLLWPWQGQRWHAALPGSRLVRLRGLGHLPMGEDPAAVVDVVRRTVAAAR